MRLSMISHHAGIALALVLMTLAVAALPGTALAADNTATGDINGIVADLNNSNTFTINSSTLALVKAAFLTDGTQLTTGTTVPKGTAVRFMIYIDNTTAIPVSNVNVQDVLAAGFGYTGGTIKVDNAVGTGATEAAIYASVNATSALTDLNDGDVAGISGTTISAGSTGLNAQLDINGSAVWALLFEATVQ